MTNWGLRAALRRAKSWTKPVRGTKLEKGISAAKNRPRRFCVLSELRKVTAQAS